MSTSSPETSPANAERRRFLKFGLASGAILATAGIAAGVIGMRRVSSQPTADGFHFLRSDDLALFAALIPVVLGDTLTSSTAKRDAIITTMQQRLDATLTRLAPPNQKQIRQLFDLLSFAPTRYLAAGISQPWEEASADALNQALNKWRHSRVGLLNATYRVLTKLITITYFALPISFSQSGYPGPWPVMYNAVNS